MLIYHALITIQNINLPSIIFQPRHRSRNYTLSIFCILPSNYKEKGDACAANYSYSKSSRSIVPDYSIRKNRRFVDLSKNTRTYTHTSTDTPAYEHAQNNKKPKIHSQTRKMSKKRQTCTQPNELKEMEGKK